MDNTVRPQLSPIPSLEEQRKNAAKLLARTSSIPKPTLHVLIPPPPLADPTPDHPKRIEMPVTLTSPQYEVDRTMQRSLTHIKVNADALPILTKIVDRIARFFGAAEPSRAFIERIDESEKKIEDLLERTDSLLNKLKVSHPNFTDYVLSDELDQQAIHGQMENIASLFEELTKCRQELSGLLSNDNAGAVEGMEKMRNLLRDRIELMQGLKVVADHYQKKPSIPSDLLNQLARNPSRAPELMVNEAYKILVKTDSRQCQPQEIAAFSRVCNQVTLYQDLRILGKSPEEARKIATQIWAYTAWNASVQRAKKEIERVHDTLVERALGPDRVEIRRAIFKKLSDQIVARLEADQRLCLLEEMAWHGPQLPSLISGGSTSETADAQNLEAYEGWAILKFEPEATKRWLSKEIKAHVFAALEGYHQVRGHRPEPSELYALYNGTLETELAVLTVLAKQDLEPNQKAELKIRLARLHRFDSVPFGNRVAAGGHAIRPQNAEARAERSGKIRNVLIALADPEGEKAAVGMLFDTVSDTALRADHLESLAKHARYSDESLTAEQTYWYQLYHLQATGKLNSEKLARQISTAKDRGIPFPGQLLASLQREALKADYSEEIALAYAVSGHTFDAFLNILNSHLVQHRKSGNGRSDAKDIKILKERISDRLGTATTAEQAEALYKEMVLKAEQFQPLTLQSFLYIRPELKMQRPQKRTVMETRIEKVRRFAEEKHHFEMFSAVLKEGAHITAQIEKGGSLGHNG